MAGNSSRKKHFATIGYIGLVIFIPLLLFIIGQTVLTPRYSKTMNMIITLHEGENINGFSKKYKLKPYIMYDTLNGTFYYPEKEGEDFQTYLEEVKRYPEVEYARLGPWGIVK